MAASIGTPPAPTAPRENSSTSAKPPPSAGATAPNSKTVSASPTRTSCIIPCGLSASPSEVRRKHHAKPVATLGYVRGIRKKEKGGAVSRFLFLNLSFIFATYPPAGDGPSPFAGIFGLAGPVPYPRHVAIPRRGLLPRVFTLAGRPGSWPQPLPGRMRRRSFSVTESEDYSPLRFPQTGALSCADFPQRRSAATDRPTFFRRKGSDFSGIVATFVTDSTGMPWNDECPEVRRKHHAKPVATLGHVRGWGGRLRPTGARESRAQR